MASKGRSTWWLRLIVAVAAVSTWWLLANSDPQINNLGKGCSSVFAKNITDFFNHLNTTFSDMRTQLSQDKRFATGPPVNSPEPVYAMVQCRKYLSLSDCLACYDTAASEIQSCSPSSGARVTYDGCFLRYESYNFYKKTNENALMCGNKAAPAGFSAEGKTLLGDLQQATPMMNGYFAARKREVPNGRNSTIYAVAQCVETITQGGCQGCLTAAYETIQSCFTTADGRLTDAACFMRFSDTPFFPDNQITDITIWK